MSLSTQQTQAVLDPAPHKAIKAGAGSGKTYTLVAQVQRWVADGIDPDKIVAISFTRRAGEELARRLAKAGIMIGWNGTAHGWAFSSMVRFGFGISPMTEDDLADIVAMHMLSYGPEWRGKGKAIATRVLADLDGKPDAEKKAKGGAAAIEDSIVRLVKGYIKSQRLVLVGNMIKEFIFRLAIEPRFLEWVNARTQVIAWDEYQDADQEEHDLLRRILAPKRTLVIGDPRQAIYSFRGGSPNFLLDTQHQEATVAQHLLDVSYRLPEVVLPVANELQPAFPPMHGTGKDGTFYFVEADAGDVGAMALELQAIQQHMCAPITCLCRTNARCAELAWQIGREAHLATADMKRTGTHEMFAVYDALRFVLQPQNDWVVHRLHSRFGTGASPYLDGKAWLPSSGFRYIDALDQSGTMPEVMQRLRMLTQDTCVLDVLATCPELAKGQPVDHAELSIREWVGWWHSRDISDVVQLPEGACFLVMTAHSSKGLEWPHVAVVALGDVHGSFPSNNKTADEEEEKRLLYVACTRAAETLHVLGERDTWYRMGGQL
jgi:DNA helicase-2/ATP-dependent DNA helicase PcrA